MPDIATVGLSQQRGHDGCGPTVGETGSSLMLVNGREVMTVTSTFVGHSCEHHGWHVPTVAQVAQSCSSKDSPWRMLAPR